LRRRILTAHERKVIETYLKEDGERDSTTRSIARYVRESLDQLRKDLVLIEKFSRVYAKRNGKRERG
jgi:hypothetical protein